MINDVGMRSSDISDIKTCGEDLGRNLDIVAQLARVHCTECGGHHLRYAVLRLVRRRTPIDFDRVELIARIRSVVEAIGTGRSGAIDIVIGGAADTGILATCAHAVAGLAEAPRIRFTVLDICETPLALCREFGKWHGLNVETHVVDLRRPDTRVDADMVVLHSILRQIRPDLHVGLLEELTTWLKPEGRLLFSNRIHRPTFQMPKQERIDFLADLCARGELTLSVPLQEIADALVVPSGWVHDFQSVDEIRDLCHAAGLAAENEAYVEGPETRYVALLRPVNAPGGPGEA